VLAVALLAMLSRAAAPAQAQSFATADLAGT
jgi:hypothetical protein